MRRVEKKQVSCPKMLPGRQVKLTFSTAQISPRFLSWKRLDKLRASIIAWASRLRVRTPVYYVRTIQKLRLGYPHPGLQIVLRPLALWLITFNPGLELDSLWTERSI